MYPGRRVSQRASLSVSTAFAHQQPQIIVEGRLRKALNIEGAADPIRTVRSAGYSLDSANVGNATAALT